jgi:hypothetical protein
MSDVMASRYRSVDTLRFLLGVMEPSTIQPPPITSELLCLNIAANLLSAGAKNVLKTFNKI